MKNSQQIYKGDTPVVSLCFQEHTGLLVAVMGNGTVVVLDSSREYSVTAEFYTAFGSVSHAEIHPTEALLAIAGDEKLEIWDTKEQRRIFYYQFDEGVGLGSSMVFHPGSARLFFGGYDYDVISVDYTAGEIDTLFAGADFNVCFALHPAGNIVAASYVIPQDGSGIGFFFCTPDGDAVQYDAPHIGIGAEVQPRMVFSADGQLLVVAYANLAAEQNEQDIAERGAILGTVQIYEFPSCRKVHTVLVKGDIDDMEKSGRMYRAPDELSNVVAPGGGHYAACGTAAGTLVLIDTTTGQIVESYRSGEAVVSLALASSTSVAAGCADGAIILCDYSDSIVGQTPNAEADTSEQAFLRMAEEGEW